MSILETIAKLFKIEKLSKRGKTSEVGDDLVQLAQAKNRIQNSKSPVMKWESLPSPAVQFSNLPIVAPQSEYPVSFAPIAMPISPNETTSLPISGMIPISLPQTEAPPPTEAGSKESETVNHEQLDYIEKVTTRNTPVMMIDKNNQIMTGVGATTEDFTNNPKGPYQVEKIQLDDRGIVGLRTAEGRNMVVDSGDASSILIFSYLGPNGVERRVRTTLVSDGVGSSAIGDYAAKILTSRAQEYIAAQVSSGRIKKNEEIQLVMAEAAADADSYFHSINIATFRAAYEKVLTKRGISGIQLSGMMDNFNSKAKANLQGKIQLASSTLLGLSVIDEPNNPNSAMETIYLDGGDGGFDVSAGWQYESYHSPSDYVSGQAPEQIDWSRPPRDVDYYAKLTSRRQFDRPSGAHFIATLRSDGLDKLKINGRERTSEEMLRLAVEIGNYSDPIALLATLADEVPDDVTYFIIKS